MIRITGGENRSRLLETPNTTLTKPTMDKVRAAVFNALGDSVKFARVLDLFAGSGSYGFEALSRGAKEATFIDASYESIKAIKKNAANLNRENVEILNADVLSFLSQNIMEFDIIFADPPYKLDVYEAVVKTLIERKIVNDGGIIVLESERELKIDESLFKSVRFYKYGLAKIYILRK
ncbi:MAG: 16S rRNA (guanine(966)-N(2))-methyltransferase RsmD [Bacilli bacterium]|nr:16S rRNA (guanine(966)-N(2))-methyltransferase RsmD [Bacilli bacterium]